MKGYFNFWRLLWIHIKILVKMRSCLWKMELGFRLYSLSLLGPNCLYVDFSPQTPYFTILGSKNVFHVKLHKMLHKVSPYFQNLDNFWLGNKDLIPEKAKKPIRNTLFGTILGMQVPCKSCLKKPFLRALKFLSAKKFWKCLAKFKKISQFWSPLIKAFQMI